MFDSFTKPKRIKFIMLVGVPGSGKSTHAKNNYNNNNFTIVSSDAIRKELFGDENCQNKPELVFHTMKQRALENLNNGKSVVYDATNIKRKDRLSVLDKIPNFVYKRADIIWSPYEVCIARNEARERTVPYEVIDKMLKNFQMPYWDEGFDEINIVNTYKGLNWVKDFSDLVEKLKTPHDNPHHAYNILQHIEMSAKHIRDNYGYFDDGHQYFNNNTIEDIYHAAGLHDIGKYPTKSFINSKGEKTETAHYYGHQGYSTWMACEYIESMIHPIETLWLINNHMEPFFESKYYKNLPKHLKDSLAILHEADLVAH